MTNDETGRPAEARGATRNHQRLIAGGVAAIALAGAAAFNQWRARTAEADHPPVGRFITVDGVKLHYAEAGSGPTILLLHGNGVTLVDYQASGLFDLLAADHHVIAFDRPGFGYSERPRTTIWTPTAQGALLRAALTQLGITRPVIVGHSWGALVALAMGLDDPDGTAGLGLMSGFYYPTARPDVLPGLLPGIPLLGDAMAHTISPLFGRLIGPAAIKASFSPAQVTDSFLTSPVSLSLRPSQVRATGADTALMVPAAISLSARYGELDMPVTIIAGEGDKIAFVNKHAERLADELADGTLRLLPGVGHMIHHSAPIEVAEAITALVGRST